MKKIFLESFTKLNDAQKRAFNTVVGTVFPGLRSPSIQIDSDNMYIKHYKDVEISVVDSSNILVKKHLL